jgi:hypothetical protein
LERLGLRLWAGQEVPEPLKKIRRFAEKTSDVSLDPGNVQLFVRVFFHGR